MRLQFIIFCGIVALACSDDELPDGVEKIKTPAESGFEEMSNGNAEQQGSKDGKMIEGDIAVPETEEGGTDRNIVTEKKRRWPKDNGIVKVPYVIDESFPKTGRTSLLLAIKDFRQWTCIDITPRTNEKFYIKIVSETGCWSPLGNQRNAYGMQKLSLGLGCTHNVGKPTHELMHALGFRHEQNRSDRDDHVTIVFDSIDPKMAYNFIKCPDTECTLPKFPYDFDSVMHYEDKAFTVDGWHTIIAKNKSAELGQRFGMSNLDIKKLNEHYRCRGKTVEPNDGVPPLERPHDSTYTCMTWSKTCADPKDDYKRYKECPRTCWGMVKGSNFDAYPGCANYMPRCNEAYFKNNCANTCGHPRPTHRD